MGNELAWGEALKSLGGSVGEYAKQQHQDEKDRKLAAAILARTQQEQDNAIQLEKTRLAGLSLTDFMQGKGRQPVQMATPGVPYTGDFAPQIPDTSSYGNFIVKPQSERPLTSAEMPSYFSGMFGVGGAQPMSNVSPGDIPIKPMTSEDMAMLDLKNRQLAQQQQHNTASLALQQKRIDEIKKGIDFSHGITGNAKAALALKIDSSFMYDPRQYGTPEEKVQLQADKDNAYNHILSKVSEIPEKPKGNPYKSVPPAKMIRVLWNGKTGSIPESKFDSKTMKKI